MILACEEAVTLDSDWQNTRKERGRQTLILVKLR